MLKGIGLVPIVIGVLILVLTKKPTDQQMDEWFALEIEDLNQKALSKLGIDASQCVAKSVVVYGPRVENMGGANLLVAKGSDGLVRYTPVDISIMNIGQDQLFCYQCCYDRTTGNSLIEETDEYFYRDVVSVATKNMTRQATIRAGRKGKEEIVVLTNSENFQLTTSGGTAFSVFLYDRALLELRATRGGQLPRSAANKAIQAIRSMLRDKKGSGSSPSVPMPSMPQLVPASLVNNSGNGEDATRTKLTKLKRLLDDGLITQEDFQAQKRSLLENM